MIDQNKGLLHLINNDNNKEYEKNIQHNKDKLKQNNKNIRDNSSQNLFNQNKYKKIDILIKNIIDLEISQHISSPPKENKFINYKIYAYYAIIQFIFHILQNNDEQAGKIFSKYIKNIFTTLLNINHTILCNENILSLANKTLLFIVFINHHLIKDNEKEFFNFLFIQLNKYNEYMLPIIQEIFVTYLKKKKKLMLNKEIYQYLDNYLNDNISLLLKYGKKENLFFFLNVLSIYKIFIKKYISNNDRSLATTIGLHTLSASSIDISNAPFSSGLGNDTVEKSESGNACCGTVSKLLKPTTCIIPCTNFLPIPCIGEYTIASFVREFL